MNKKSKKVLVTGGTGFLGKKLCHLLLNQGYIVYVLTRQKKAKKTEDSTQNLIYVNDLSELSNIDCDIIINLAGETISKRWTETTKRNIYNSRILTTRILVDYIKSRKNKPSLFISGSAVGIYGTDPQKTFDENSDTLSIKQGFASNLCKSWEEEANQAKQLGLRVVLLRIGPVLEKNGGMLAKLLPSFYLGLGAQIGDGNQWLSWIDRDDLYNLILFIIADKTIEGPVNATSPSPVTNKEFTSGLAKVLNRPSFFKIPAFIFNLIFGQMANEIMLEGQKVLPTKALTHGFKFSYPTLQESLLKYL